MKQFLESSDTAKRNKAPHSSESDSALGKYIKSSKSIEALRRRNVFQLFPIQYSTYDLLFNGVDLIGRDKTGSGKTLAYSLPIIERLRTHNAFKNHSVKMMIVLPTRELAIQVRDEISSFRYQSTENDFNILAVYGKNDMNKQIEAIKDGVDIIVATLGRLKDLLTKDVIDVSQLQVLCFDEADQLLSAGSKEDIHQIFQYLIGHAPGKTQNLMFSATIPQWVRDMSSEYQGLDCKYIDMVGEDNKMTPDSLSHFALKISIHTDQYKAGIIKNLMSKFAMDGQVLIFCERKVDVDNLSQCLNTIANQPMHGDIPQFKRENAYRMFKNKQLTCLIATNVAARGLDFPEIPLVIQADPPKTSQFYLHRSGRTARTGKKGTCITLFGNKTQSNIEKIESELQIQMERLQESEFRPPRNQGNHRFNENNRDNRDYNGNNRNYNGGNRDYNGGNGNYNGDKNNYGGNNERNNNNYGSNNYRNNNNGYDGSNTSRSNNNNEGGYRNNRNTYNNNGNDGFNNGGFRGDRNNFRGRNDGNRNFGNRDNAFDRNNNETSNAGRARKMSSASVSASASGTPPKKNQNAQNQQKKRNGSASVSRSRSRSVRRNNKMEEKAAKKSVSRSVSRSKSKEKNVKKNKSMSRSVSRSRSRDRNVQKKKSNSRSRSRSLNRNVGKNNANRKKSVSKSASRSVSPPRTKNVKKSMSKSKSKSRSRSNSIQKNNNSRNNDDNRFNGNSFDRNENSFRGGRGRGRGGYNNSRNNGGFNDNRNFNNDRNFNGNRNDGPRPQQSNNQELFTQSLPRDVSESQIRQFFEDKGFELAGFKLLKTPEGQSKGVGFAKFRSQSDRDNCLKSLNNAQFNDNSIRLSLPRPKQF